MKNQSAAIALYAAAHRMGIVRSYVDAGKSGLTITHRKGLQELIRIVGKHQADFEVILVYDVSRWGRFPDADEAAHYEFICKKAGVQVRYCAEQFENDNSATSNLLKALKRTMAGEYSRELSTKIFTAQCRLASMGFWQGGPAPYAMRRQIVDKYGKRKQALESGERKSVTTDRVILIPGPANEISDIRYIFDSFTKRKKLRSEILAALKMQGKTFQGRPWVHGTIVGLLTNPVYTGKLVFLRRSRRRAGPRRFNPREKWIVRNGVVPQIISDRQFELAQRILREQAKEATKEEMLEDLRRLWRRNGQVCIRLINQARRMRSLSLYYKKFGSLTEAYRLIGYSQKGCSYIPLERRRQLRSEVLSDLTSRITAAGGTVSHVPKRYDTLLINGQLTVAFRFSVPRIWRGGIPIWSLSIHRSAPVDIAIIVRLKSAAASGILDYLVVPRLADIDGTYFVKADGISAFIDVYRTTNLSELATALGCSQIQEAA
jgi:DNA invertase Pin-like site-specific DNA recombinase